MNRALVLGGGLVAIAIVAAVVVIGGGGPATDDAPPATTVATVPTPAAPNPTAPTPAVEAAPAAASAPATTPPDRAATGNAPAEFETWAAPLRAAGLAVTADSVVREGDVLIASGLSIADPSPAPRWRWLVDEAAIDNDAAGRANLSPRGSQTLELVDLAGSTTTLEASAERLSIAVERDPSGSVTAIALEATGVAVARANQDPLRIGSLALGLVPAAGPGPGATPAHATGTIALANLVSPAASASPLGTRIERIAADFALPEGIAGLALGDLVNALATPEGVALSDLDVGWGVLVATGSGTLRLDDARRLAGTLVLGVTQPLTVLDAVHAVRGLDRAVMPDVYAAILAELGDRPAAVPDFVVDMTGGEIILRGAERATGDLTLGTLAPLP
ncbi:MAG: DUF2125 domain-containing protein [Bauldia sp.]|nr:DUF2125 domain-containing protein [Bauldia sp.]